MNKAEKYLIENKTGTVFVRYRGRKRRLFFSSHDNVCMVRRGHSFWGKSFPTGKVLQKSIFLIPKLMNNEK